MKNTVVWDIVCYVIFPLVVWNVLRGPLGDYPAMLISTVPGIIYTLIRFWKIRKWNTFGIFMITTLVLGTIVDVSSGGGLQFLWNNIFYSYALSLFFLITIIIKKPLFLYFALDLMEVTGKEKDKVREFFFSKKPFRLFQYATLIFVVRDVSIATFKWYLVVKYGVESFDEGLVVRQVINWGFTFLSVFVMMKIASLASEVFDEEEEDMDDTNESPINPDLKKI